MIFSTFCNICFTKENIIKLCEEENERILNILISFTSCPDIVSGIIYLCTNCCKKLEEYDNFRELYLTNFVRFRYLYNEHKKQLEIHNEPDIDIQLKAFVDVNVERPSGTALIENYDAAQALRNDTTCNVDITYKMESDGELKIEFDELLIKNDLRHAENSTLENNREACHQNSFHENQEKNGNSIVKRSTDNENKPVTSDIVCNVCDKSFSYGSDLDVHMRTHTREKHYKCDKCQKTFADTAMLKIHKRSHSGKRSYKCDECGLEFTQSNNLKRHNRIHTGEKPYKCDECDYTCTQRSNLKTHKRRHTGEKPYKCDVCGFRFTHIHTLKAHKHIHTGEKPYKCDECGVGFSDRSNLRTHKRVHTDVKPYKCVECGLDFKQRSSFKRHKLVHTGEIL